MSFLSSISSFFKKLWNKVKKILSQILNFIKPYLPFILVGFVLLLPYLAPILVSLLPAGLGSALIGAGSFIGGLGGWSALGLGVGVSVLIAPEETASVISSVVESAGTVLSKSAAVVGDVLGDVLGAGVTALVGSLASSPWMWMLGAGLFLWWLGSDSGDEPSTVILQPSGSKDQA